MAVALYAVATFRRENMMQVFQVDSPLYKFLQRFLDVLILNFWLMVCCIPIITAGASITAAYSVALKMVREEEGYITKSFFKALKENWKQGTVLWLITIVCSYIIYLDFEVYRSYEDGPVLLLIIGILACIALFSSILYAYPQAARYENTVKQYLENSRQITIRFFGKTMLLIFLVMFEVVLAIFNSVTIFFAIIIGPTVIIYTISGICVKIFDEIELEKKEK